MTEQYQTHWVDVDGTRLCVFEAGQGGTQQVLLVHATGFHARCWDRVIAALPDTMHVFAIDLRGHGRSDKHPPYQWDRFAADVQAVIEHFDMQHIIGVGHSLGGHCVAHVCALAPHRFTRLLLIDPVIFDPQMYAQREPEFARVEDHPIAKRRGHFDSWQAMYERFASRYPYSVWQADVLRDYCQFGVLPSSSGSGVDLACPGLVEASVYMTNFDTDIYPLLDNIKQPVTVLRAKPRDANSEQMDFSASPTWPELAATLPNGEDVFLPELTHFIPMQAPELVADYIVRSDQAAR